MSDTTLADARRLADLRTLTEVSRALTYATSIEEVLRLTVERAAELMRAEKALILLTDEDGLLRVRASHGVADEDLRDIREPLTETLTRRLQDLLGYPEQECFLSVPLVAQGEVTGLLAAVRRLPAARGEDDEWLLSALADQAAVALENARLTEAVRAGRDDRSRMIEAQARVHATLGHELRSPLTAVQAYSTLLLDDVFGPLNDRQRESIGRIRMSGEHLITIIENLMDLARINAGVLTVDTRAVRVAEVITEAVHMVQPLAGRKSQELRTEAAEDLVVRADADRLRQALVNLLDNATKYTPERGVVEVGVARVEREGKPCALVRVRDSGRGMASDMLARIFEPYDRGGSATNEPGLGLGLFISRELVRQMGGEIEVESQPGSGSTFTVFLALAERGEGGAGPGA